MVDINNGIVDIDAAIAAPERIAAVFYVYDDRTLGNVNTSTTVCETGKREIALGNEAMVEEFFGIGTVRHFGAPQFGHRRVEHVLQRRTPVWVGGSGRR